MCAPSDSSNAATATIGDWPLIGTVAAIGLVQFFVCATYTHVLARDYSSQFGLALGFLLLAVAALVVNLAR